jgi:hypothetical protein
MMMLRRIRSSSQSDLIGTEMINACYSCLCYEKFIRLVLKFDVLFADEDDELPSEITEDQNSHV